MEIPGRVQNGVVVFDGPFSLPDGLAVIVTVGSQPGVQIAKVQKRVEFPLVKSSAPASVRLTNEMIEETLDAEDAPS